MAKRQPSITLSFVLLRFTVLMLGCMLLCGLLWLVLITGLQTAGFIYHGSVSNQQAEEMLKDHPAVFAAPDENFLPEYALFDTEGAVLKTNTKGRELDSLREFFQTTLRICILSGYTYKDGSTLVLRWHYRREFTDPGLRALLPPFEYLWFCLPWNSPGSLSDPEYPVASQISGLQAPSLWRSKPKNRSQRTGFYDPSCRHTGIRPRPWKLWSICGKPFTTLFPLNGLPGRNGKGKSALLPMI